MKLPSNQLEAFYQLAKDLNFTKAAENINITQSAFSTRILKLEDTLELTLFTREKSNIRLTEAGERLLQYCSKALTLEEELIGDLTSNNNKLKGNIRIGGFSSIMRSLVLPALTPILNLNPELGIEFLTGEIRDLIPLLKNGKVDYLISDQEASNINIDSILLGYETNVLIESQKGCPKNIYLDHDLNDVTTDSYLKLKPELQNNIRKRYLDDIYGILDGVSLGLGRAIVPRHLIKNRKDINILYPKTNLKVPLYLLTFKSQFKTKLEQQVINHLKNISTKL